MLGFSPLSSTPISSLPVASGDVNVTLTGQSLTVSQVALAYTFDKALV